MATTVATLAVKVTADASGAARELDGAAGKVSRFQSGLSRAALPAAAIAGGLVAFGKSAFDAASAAEQAAGAVDAVFGKTAGAVHKFAQSSAEDVGLASGDYEQMAATFGAQLKNMGIAAGDLAPTTNELITLGADLAAQYGGSTADAVAALGSLMRGETDPIERYGVSIKQADIEARKAEMGLSDLTGEAGKQADMQARLALLTEQTANATGAFSREADTAAGQQARATAAWEDASAELGEALLPVVSQVAKAFAGFAGLVKRNKTVFQVLAVVLGIVAGAVLALNVAMGALNAVMAANPVVLVVIAIAALVAGLVLAYKKSKTFRDIVQSVGRVAATVFKAIVNAVKVAIRWVVKVAKVIGRGLTAAFRVAKRVGSAVFKVLKTAVKIYLAPVYVAVRIARVVLPAAFRVLQRVGKAAFAAIRAVVRTTIAVVRNIIQVVRGVLTAAFRTARAVASSVFSAIRGFIRTTIAVVRTIIQTVRNTLAGAFRTAREVARTVFSAIRTVIQTVIDKVQAVVDKVEDVLGPVWSAMETAATAAFDAITGAIETVIGAIDEMIGWIQDAIDWFGDLLGASTEGTANLDRAGRATVAGAGVRIVSRSAAPAVPAARGTTRAGATSAGSAGGVVINVTGALDPDAVARQIERILLGRSRRVSGITAR